MVEGKVSKFYPEVTPVFLRSLLEAESHQEGIPSENSFSSLVLSVVKEYIVEPESDREKEWEIIDQCIAAAEKGDSTDQ